MKEFEVKSYDRSGPAVEPSPGYVPVESVDVDIAPSRLKPGETEKDSEIARWLESEILSHAEIAGVIERFAKENDPGKMDVHYINERFKQLRGKGWGDWSNKLGSGCDRIDDPIQQLKLTAGDIRDMNTLAASFKDHVAVHEWYLRFRRKRLKNCIRYAQEPDLTLDQFVAMNDKLQNDTFNTLPQPAHLTDTSKRMQEEAAVKPDQLATLLTKTLEAKDALFAAMADLGNQVEGFKKISDAYARDIHAFKSSVVLDINAAKREMADVRKFFLEKEHVEEMARLKEFIELCEKLKALKDSGMLDAVAETILKLEGA